MTHIPCATQPERFEIQVAKETDENLTLLVANRDGEQRGVVLTKETARELAHELLAFADK